MSIQETSGHWTLVLRRGENVTFVPGVDPAVVVGKRGVILREIQVWEDVSVLWGGWEHVQHVWCAEVWVC